MRLERENLSWSLFISLTYLFLISTNSMIYTTPVAFDIHVSLMYYLLIRDIIEEFEWRAYQMPSCTNKIFGI